ncbi:hypothetical protein [Flavobacterium aestuarii]|uniref:hypothetical protein n=1 Tax=Flavobacterium aestuarii TaxID=3149227 RepID=UPI0032B5D83C
MKMLILTAFIALGSILQYADRDTASQIVIKESDIQSKYVEVSVNAVPDAIKATLETAYSGTKLIRAYVNQKKEYKLELSIGNRKATVYTDVNGNW